MSTHNVPNSSGTEAPRLKAPKNAADCHIHIYDARYAPPVARPANATVADYRLLQSRIGTSRVVIVTPRNYGADNAVTVDAIAELGIDNARGVGVVRTDVTDAQLKKLNEGGIRGLRFTIGNPETAVTSIDMIEPLAKRIAEYGWHVQINAEPGQVVDAAAMLRRLPCPIVFDHLGKLGLHGLDHPSYRVMRELIDAGRAWVKISGAYLNTRIGPPAYPESTPVAQAFVKAAPERAVWGSDWPHPTPKIAPDDAVLFDLLLKWVEDDALIPRILVQNPEALYGFPKTA
ncbi:MAG TPA: amidohydrolase family protein [Burkholderiales bacterium]|nr:amidohydrolase family protein [Burkholderiales bacterium]